MSVSLVRFPSTFLLSYFCNFFSFYHQLESLMRLTFSQNEFEFFPFFFIFLVTLVAPSPGTGSEPHLNTSHIPFARMVWLAGWFVSGLLFFPIFFLRNKTRIIITMERNEEEHKPPPPPRTTTPVYNI